jgi:ribulose-phosphate 3-epimerase
MSTEIIPAIMPSSFTDLKEKAEKVSAFVGLAQIDIMDGVFVPSKSWPYTEGGVGKEPHFLALSKQDEGLPEWEDLDYEIDLMITEPEKHIDEWLPLGAARLIFHIESVKDIDAFFGHDIFKPEARSIGKHKVIELGLAINPDTSLDAILPHISKVDFVQCMGIAKIGYQGQPFDERVLAQIHALRLKYPDMPISVDGGVNLATAHDLKGAGATRLVSGSAIFNAEDAEEAITALQNA